MANPTRFYLSEQVRYKLVAGYPNILESVQMQDIMAAIGQKINSILKLQYFTDTLQLGDSIPNNLMLATYEGVALESYGRGKCKAILPVMPVSMTRNIGVYMVSTDENFECLWIPMQAGQANLLKGQRLINNLLGQVGYEIFGNTLVATQDVTIDNITTVNMRLLVMDIDSYDDYTPLPLPADYATTIIDEVYKSFLPVEATANNNKEMTKDTKQIGK